VYSHDFETHSINFGEEMITKWNSGSVRSEAQYNIRRRLMAACCILAALVVAVLATPVVAQAQGETVLYAFQGVQSLLYSFQGGSDGLTPEWGLITGPGGTLYGTTSVGGGTGCPAQAYNGTNIGCGTVFQFTP
jgi:hypothetical protein